MPKIMTKLELFLLAGVAFFVVDTYYDNKYTKQFSKYKKHFKIAAAIFAVGSLMLFMKKNPGESSKLLGHLNGMVQYMPIDKNSKDMLTPFLTSRAEQTIQTSGADSTARSVSGTKKKYVAASQQWKCGECRAQLDAWFEVDHKIRLADGGSNHVSNLVALCRNCHGKKTTFENM
jgi:hypothetical protein